MCGNWRLATSAAAHVTEKDERKRLTHGVMPRFMLMSSLGVRLVKYLLLRCCVESSSQLQGRQYHLSCDDLDMLAVHAWAQRHCRTVVMQEGYNKLPLAQPV